MASKRAQSKKKQAEAFETSESIAAQVEAFLEAGGSIEKIANGVSGQTSLAAKKSISLGNSKK